MTCDHRLQRLLSELIKIIDFSVTCGHRCQQDQALAYETGHSKLEWPHSKHNSLPSMAVDIQPYPLPKDEIRQIQCFKELAVLVKEAAARQGVILKWGGDYVTWKDYPHWELSE